MLVGDKHVFAAGKVVSRIRSASGVSAGGMRRVPARTRMTSRTLVNVDWRISLLWRVLEGRTNGATE
ncbi:MAG: hypothetical protein ACTHQQ_17915 [Solirubrobacteraceae bacterium]